MLKKPNSNVI